MALLNPYSEAIQKAKDELVKVGKKIEELQSLKKRKMTLEAFISNATQLLEVPAAEPEPEPKLALSLSKTRTVRIPLWKFIQAAMRGNANALSAKEVLDVLVSRNVEVRGEFKTETVRGAMTGKPEIFERTDDGKFRLRPIGEPQALTGLKEDSATQEITH